MYLGLTGLVALMVGGIGVAVSVSAFVREKLATIAILKCARRGLAAAARRLPAPDRAARAWAAACSAPLLGSAVQPLLAPALTPLLPIALSTLSLLSARRRSAGLAMGVGVTLLYALWPLLQIRRVPPALILRQDVEPRLPGRRPWAGRGPDRGGPRRARALAGGLVEGRRALRRAASPPRSLLLAAGSARPSSRWRAPCRWRARSPGGRARPISTAPAATRAPCWCRSASRSCSSSRRAARAEPARRARRLADPASAPAFFFIDIQPDQAAPFAPLVAGPAGRGARELTPVVRSRLAAINGAPVAQDARQRREDAWYLTREYVLTWAAQPPAHNPVVAGRWWTAGGSARASR